MKYLPLRLRLLLLLLLAALCICTYVFHLSDEEKITRAKFANIRVGITQEEVESILGGPAAWIGVTSSYPDLHSHWVHIWIAPNGTTVNVTLDSEGRVLEKRLGPRDKTERWLWLRRFARRIGL